jgi:sensor domain CHASE-containing protein
VPYPEKTLTLNREELHRLNGAPEQFKSKFVQNFKGDLDSIDFVLVWGDGVATSTNGSRVSGNGRPLLGLESSEGAAAARGLFGTNPDGSVFALPTESGSR